MGVFFLQFQHFWIHTQVFNTFTFVFGHGGRYGPNFIPLHKDLQFFLVPFAEDAVSSQDVFLATLSNISWLQLLVLTLRSFILSILFHLLTCLLCDSAMLVLL